MEPQPLSFTYDLRNSASSMTIPTEVNIENCNQLGNLSIREFRLKGSIDLSTFTRVNNFNVWLSLTSHRLMVGEKFRTEPKGHYHVELSDESTVTITATLTCKNDFNNLAIEMLELLEPMHNMKQQ